MSDSLRVAAVYIRVSTDDQADLSPDSQLSTIRDYAGKNNILVPDDYVFVDEGISGRSADKRPAFKQMIALAKQTDHPVDLILLWKFSRFARNQEESIVYKSMLHRSGVDVVSISEPIIDGPFGSLIERIIEWMDEYYSIRLSGEVKRSMAVNAQRGVRQSIVPFGYRKGGPGEPFMVPDPEESEIIREVYSRYAAGELVQPLVYELNARGIRSKRGSVIENRTIMYWLQNPVYIGKNRWTPTGRTRRDFHNPDTVVVDGDHAPLVSQELFDTVQLRVAAASAAHRPKSRPSFALKDWMGGVVRCAACGNTLVFAKPHYFICNGYIRANCAHRQSIAVDVLHDAVLSLLRSDLASPRGLSCTIISSASAQNERRTLELQQAQIEKKLQRARDAYASGIDTLEEYRRYKSSLDSELSAVAEKLSRLSASSDSLDADSLLRSAIRSVLQTLESPETTKEEKNTAIKSIVDTCLWDKSSATLTISYRIFI